MEKHKTKQKEAVKVIAQQFSKVKLPCAELADIVAAT
jgi:hypothetical protein